MHLTPVFRCGYHAALVVLLFAGIGCSTTTRPVSSPGRVSSSLGGNVQLTPDEERLAKALAHYGTGMMLMASEGPAAALPEYRKSLELDPRNENLALTLSEYYRSQRDLTNSLAVVDCALAANAKSADLWIAKGIAYRSAEDNTNAVVAFKQALKVEPAHSGAVRALTDTYLLLDDTNNVLAVLDQAFRQTAADVHYWTAIGDTFQYVLRNKPSLAARLDRQRIRICYEKALALAPRDPEVLLRVGDAYLAANDSKAAADIYARLLELRPNLPQLRERLAAVYLKNEQPDKALALYKELIRREPTRFEFYNVAGELLEELRQPEQAATYFEQSLQLNPDQSEVYLALCDAYRQLKRPEALQKTLADWKKKYPLDWRIPYFNASVLTAEKKYADAIAAFADAERVAGESPQEIKLSAQFYFAFGAACERGGDIEKAAAKFLKAINLNPKFATALNYLGYMWADKGINLTESLKYIQQAVELEPDSSAYLDSLGWVLHKLGRNEEALPHLRRAVELLEADTKKSKEDRQEDAVVYDHLAEVLSKLGKTKEAVQAWKRALELDPANKDLAEKLQRQK